MEHSFEDLLSDAFSDTVLPCYHEGELDFDSLNLEQGDGEGNGNSGFEGLLSLAEVDEDDDQEEEEEADHVTTSTLTEEQNCSKCDLPQREDWEDTVGLGEQEVKDGQNNSAENKDSTEDKDAQRFSYQLDSSQTISFGGKCLDGDPMKDTKNTRSGNAPQDQRNELEFFSRGANSVEGDGLESSRADADSGTYSNAVADADVVIDPDMVTDADADIVPDTESVADRDTNAVLDTDIVTDIVTDAVPGSDSVEDIFAVAHSDGVPDAVTDEHAVAHVDVWIGGFAEKCCYSAREELQDCFLQVLQAEPFRGELNEFSEADCGVIGEGYAEYPSEEEKECEDKEKDMEEELGGKFSGISRSEVEWCGEQKTGGSEGVGSEGETKGNGRKGKEKEREDVGLCVEKEIEVSGSSSLRSEAYAEESELLNEGSVAEPASLRALSIGPHYLRTDPDSQEEGATELFSSTQAHRNKRTKEGELGNMEAEEEEEEEEEEERNWEQERERIQAFYRYYNDDKEEDYVRMREDKGHFSRKHMVRFCLDSHPVQRDSDSTDTDVVSSSSEGTEGSDTAVTSTVTRRPVKIEEDGNGESLREKFSLLLKQSQVTQVELKKLTIELRAQHQKNRIHNIVRFLDPGQNTLS